MNQQEKDKREVTGFSGNYIIGNSSSTMVSVMNGIRTMHLQNIKPVIDVNSGIEYKSVADASEKTGIGITLVRKVCLEKDGYEEYKGFKFRYITV